jgi:hypothetical protein
MACGCKVKAKRQEPAHPELPLEEKLMRRVYTFFYPGSPSAAGTLGLWVRSWKNNGWSPVVLTPVYYESHPMLRRLRERIAKLPTVNDRNYEAQCYLRWLAFDTRAPGVFSDFDTINYSMKPEDVPRVPEGDPKILSISHAGHPNPGLFVANQAGVRSMLHDFLHAEIPRDTIYGRPHTSDMYYFFRRAVRAPGVNRCPNVGLGDWTHAPCVHWHNSGIVRLGRSPADRPNVIQKLRPVP